MSATNYCAESARLLNPSLTGERKQDTYIVKKHAQVQSKGKDASQESVTCHKTVSDAQGIKQKQDSQ